MRESSIFRGIISLRERPISRLLGNPIRMACPLHIISAINRKFLFLTGETSAGKSSLINLLLSDHVLPTHILQNTYTICEISYGPRKEAVIHFSKEDSLELEESEFDKIQQFIEQPLPAEDDNRCERIEIKIPNQLLEVQMIFICIQNCLDKCSLRVSGTFERSSGVNNTSINI